MSDKDRAFFAPHDCNGPAASASFRISSRFWRRKGHDMFPVRLHSKQGVLSLFDSRSRLTLIPSLILVASHRKLLQKPVRKALIYNI